MNLPVIRESTLIQASHHIIQWLEESKQNVDDFIDDSVEAFCVVSLDGTILRGNRRFASLYDTDMERVRGRQLKEIFSRERWRLFKKKLQGADARSDGTSHTEFELAVDLPEHATTLMMLWSVSAFYSGDGHHTRFFAVSGRDLTEARACENRYSSLYANIPLGILEINADFIISDHFSAYAEVLLDCEDLPGQSLWDLLFRPALAHLPEHERARLGAIRNVFGTSADEFDLLSKPEQLQLSAESGGRTLGLSLAPIFSQGKVARLLVILEERTHLC